MNTVLKEQKLPSGQIIKIIYGDIISEETDAIVNAANTSLQHGGGVARAISKHAGPTLQQESDAWIQEKGQVSHKDPAWTSGGLLPAKYVIHAVGPMWGDGDEDAKLTAAVTGSLGVADELKLNSIAFPAISTGIFGFPKDRAAKVIMEALGNYFDNNSSSEIMVIKLVLFDQGTVDAFLQE